MNPLEKLLSISSESLSSQPVSISIPGFENFGSLGTELLSLLQQKNGFYAFESALHLFPATSSESEININRWNSLDLWRYEYGDLAENILFFAEDAFGDQFCLYDHAICSFTSETGELKVLAKTFGAWAQLILDDYNLLTGYSLLRDWQILNGPISPDMRLMPKIPFVLGGEFAVENLYPLKSVSGMRTKGNLARQIKDMPDGTQIEIRIIE